MPFQLASTYQAHRRSAAVSAAHGASEEAGTASDGIRIRNRGHLPHWERENGAYFATFRLADSLPKAALQFFNAERRDILRRAQRQGRELTPSEQRRLTHLFSERIEKQLDSGVGECHLANPRIAQVVADALGHFEKKRYQLWAWCIMPNHVHVVVELRAGQSLAKILHSWKSYTAKEANKLLHREGGFWQREYYDHLVRDEQQLSACIRYVEDNPTKAGLQNWRWAWVSPAALPVAQEASETLALHSRKAT
jgi:REP element-mobilizing transposase RayT